jgi:RNA polymerase primary sigma factor
LDEATRTGKGETPDPSSREDPVSWIEGALAYVPSVARRFSGTGLAFDELLAAGNLGLVEAALRFDPTRNVKFVTYADWWIRKTILRAIQEQTGPVRLPRYRLEQLRDLRETRLRLTERMGREPDTEEIARAIGRPVREIRLLLAMGRRGVSIDQSAASHETRPLIGVLEHASAAC